MGGFYGGSSGVGPGLGTFGSNFNTFINPINYGRLLPEMGIENVFQYEGFGYLGLGVILLSLFVDVEIILNRKNINKYKIIDVTDGIGQEAENISYTRRLLYR